MSCPRRRNRPIDRPFFFPQTRNKKSAPGQDYGRNLRKCQQKAFIYKDFRMVSARPHLPCPLSQQETNTAPFTLDSSLSPSCSLQMTAESERPTATPIEVPLPCAIPGTSHVPLRARSSHFVTISPSGSSGQEKSGTRKKHLRFCFYDCIQKKWPVTNKLATPLQ